MTHENGSEKKDMSLGKRSGKKSDSEKMSEQETQQAQRLSELFLKNYPKNSSFAEAYRTLRTNIHFSFMDKAFRSLLVTSAGAREGKTNTVANLGYALSQTGKSVVMLDADLRKPMLGNLAASEGSIGIVGLLSHLFEKGIGETYPDGEVPQLREKLDSALSEVDKNLFLLPSGGHPPNPSEIMGSKGMSFLLSYLMKIYDIVLIDTPPILPASDAVLLAPQADGVMLVVKTGMLSRGLVKKAVEQLRLANANLIGVTLNQLNIKKQGYYYDRYYRKYYSKHHASYYGKYN